MSFSYDRYERRHSSQGSKSRLGYWVPFIVTVTAASMGLAAWIWRERQENDYYDDSSDSDQSGRRRAYNDFSTEPSGRSVMGEKQQQRGTTSAREEESLMARMSDVIRRTPSPQQVFDTASRRVAAGVAAAGAVVGGALSAIREEDKDDFGDHSRWSKEAEMKRSVEAGPSQTRDVMGTNLDASNRQGLTTNKRKMRRKIAAIVISAEFNTHEHVEEGIVNQEHASILSHVPTDLNPSTKVLVLIYSPDLKEHPLAKRTQSPERTPGVNNPVTAMSSAPQKKNPLLVAMWHQAQALVEKETHILPFTTRTGHIHMLRHLAPDIVYLQESLSSSSADRNDGDVVSQISGWVGQVVVVVGDGGGGGHGGLVDTEDEGEGGEKGNMESWWQDPSRVGLGKGVEIADSDRVGEDWARRVGGRD